MRIRFVFPAACALALTLAGAAPAQEPLTIKTLMRDHVNPAALDFWAGGNDAPEGETKAQAKDRWAAALEASKTLQQYGHMMQEPGRSFPGKWAEYAALMEQIGKEGEPVAKKKDAAKAFDLGARLYDSCAGCHNTYIPRKQAPLP